MEAHFLSTDLMGNPLNGLILLLLFLTLNGQIQRETKPVGRTLNLLDTSIQTRPLNSVGLPYYDSQLLSSWTPQFISTSLNYPPPAKIPPQILNTMKMNDNVAYAALPRELKGRRNMVVVGPRKNHGRFRSGKSRSNDVGGIHRIIVCAALDIRPSSLNPIRLLSIMPPTKSHEFTVMLKSSIPSSAWKTLTSGTASLKHNLHISIQRFG